MGAENGTSASEVFLRAIRLAPGDREAFLDQSCAGRPDVRAEVESLLAAGATSTEIDPDREREGLRTVGPYRILHLLGEGGMGAVYLAEQLEPMRRRVALKVIKYGMDSKEVVARFEAERQALALMNHPNIAQVFEAGVTANGRPYFVMEHVAGVPINRYCDTHRLTTRQRLELLLPVCEAIQHAHQKGIIHRDVKPSNILVAIQDGRALPKVIDFGVAKATSQRLTEKTLFTQLGVLVGTPEYMSPEQAEMSPLDIDTRTDIYALGVMLYELLTGALPFDPRRLRSAGYAELQRIVREEEPPKPSTRVSTLGEGASDVAHRRHSDPAALLRELKGELDWIVMRAIEKDRSRRYPAASDLAADLRRFLSGEPVLAAPPSTLYRLRKLAARHRGVLAATAAVVLALVIGLLTTSLALLESRRAESRARRSEEQAVSQAYVANLRAADVSLQLRQVQEARERLAACDPALRGWEWRHLVHRLDSSRTVLEGYAARFTEDGKRLVAVGDFGVRLWAQSPFKMLEEHSFPDGSGPSYLSGGVLNHDGSRIVTWHRTSGDHPEYRLTDWRTGKVIALPGARWTTRGSMSYAPEFAFSADGRFMTAIPTDGRPNRLGVVDVRDGRRIATVVSDEEEEEFFVAAFSPRGERLAAAGRSGAIHLWDLPSARASGIFAPEGDSVSALAFSADGLLLASGATGGIVRLYETATGKVARAWQGHGSEVSTLAFAPSGSLFASGGDDKAVRLWDPAKKRPRAEWLGHTGAVDSITFSPDGQRLLSSDLDGRSRVWDARTSGDGLLLATGSAVHGVAVDPSGARIACALAADGVQVYALPSAEPLVLLPAWGPSARGSASNRTWWIGSVEKTWSVFTVAFTPDGRTLLAGGVGAEVLLWDVAKWTRSGSLTGHTSSVSALAVSPDGKWIATGDQDGSIRVWTRMGGPPDRVLKVGSEPVLGLAFAGGEAVLAAGDRDGNIVLYEVPSFTERHRVRAEKHAVTALAFHPRTNHLLAATWNRDKNNEGEVLVYDTSTAGLVRTLPAHERAVSSLAFSPDGRRLATGSYDGSMRLWDAATFDPLLLLSRRHQYVEGVLFSPDGRRIVSGSHEGEVHIWESSDREDRPAAGR